MGEFHYFLLNADQNSWFFYRKQILGGKLYLPNFNQLLISNAQKSDFVGNKNLIYFPAWIQSPNLWKLA